MDSQHFFSSSGRTRERAPSRTAIIRIPLPLFRKPAVILGLYSVIQFGTLTSSDETTQ